MSLMVDGIVIDPEQVVQPVMVIAVASPTHVNPLVVPRVANTPTPRVVLGDTVGVVLKLL